MFHRFIEIRTCNMLKIIVNVMRIKKIMKYKVDFRIFVEIPSNSDCGLRITFFRILLKFLHCTYIERFQRLVKKGTL